MKEAGTIGGILALVILLSAVILLGDLHPTLRATRTVYEAYFDMFIVFGITIISFFLSALSIRAYRRDGNPRLAYVSGAFFLYAAKMVLVLMNMLSAPEYWLVDSVIHIFDLGILLLFFLGVLA